MGLFSDFFGNGGAPTQAWSPPSIPERFLNPSPVPEMQINDARRGILSDKRGWDEANRNINFLTKSLETPGLSDLQKQAINDNILKLNQTRDAFAASANERRANAQALGIDVSDYDSGKTLQEAAQAYSTYRNNAVKDFLNLPTVAQLEENRYLELRNRGASPAQADRILKRERAGREEEFLRRAEEGIMTYGTNSDGSLNQIGVELVRRMNPSDPQIAAALYANAFAMPKNIFTEGRADNRTALNNQSTLERQQAALAAAALENERQRQWNTWNQTEDRKFRGEQTDKTLNAQRENTEFQEAQKFIRERLKLDADQIKAYLDSPEGKFDSWYALGMKLYGDEKQAAEWAKYQVEKKAPNDSDEKLKAAANLFGNRYRDIETALRDGNKDLALQNIAAMESLLRDDSNYAELLDMGSYMAALKILDVYRKVAENKYTMNQAIIEIQELKGGKMSPDQIMAYLINMKEFGQNDPEVIRRRVNSAIQNTEANTDSNWHYTPGGNYPTPQHPSYWNVREWNK